jgi:hypothetical protein
MRRARIVLAAVVALASTGCLEPPISESVEIRMEAGGASVVTVGVALRDPVEYRDSANVQERIEAEGRSLEAGTDEWSGRLRAGDPVRTRSVVDRERGRLVRVTRHARFEESADLRAFFRDTGVGVTFTGGTTWEELTLLPGRPGRPTSSQRDRVRRELDTWSASIASYLDASSKLYAYLDRRPERARACFANLLAKPSDDDALEDEELRLTGDVDAAMAEVAAVLAATGDEPYTLDELSRMVYDPFPAPIRIVVPGAVLEREGFPGDADAPLRIPMASFWSAFERLEGRWLSPDIVLAAWRLDANDPGNEFDVGGFARQPRRSSAPDAVEVRKAIEDQLRTAPVYRVRWSADAGREAPPFPF